MEGEREGEGWRERKREREGGRERDRKKEREREGVRGEKQREKLALALSFRPAEGVLFVATPGQACCSDRHVASPTPHRQNQLTPVKFYITVIMCSAFSFTFSHVCSACDYPTN